jgi:hypothetical protein
MKKDQAREIAIELHTKLWSRQSITWEEALKIQHTIMKIGKRAGLLREFRENGLI